MAKDTLQYSHISILDNMYVKIKYANQTPMYMH